MKRAEMLVLASVMILMGGLLMPALASGQGNANRTKTMNHLKMIGFGFHSCNDQLGSLPFNGGCNTAADLPKCNYGWHTPKSTPMSSGSWVTQVLPFVEMENVAKTLDFAGHTNTAPPATYPDEKNWAVKSHLFLCAQRQRVGYKTNREPGSYPGIVTDFAVNAFVNAPPVTYSVQGYMSGVMSPGGYGDWAAANSRMSHFNIRDGSANTIIVGEKALPQTIPGKFDDRPAANGDEGVFSPGHWSISGATKKWGTTGTARGHVGLSNPPKTEPKQYTKGVPWMFRDDELLIAPPDYSLAWGSPFAEGVPFLFADGRVLMIRHQMKGTFNFARLLYPDDGRVVTFD